jgi:hypothetical protein
LGLVDNAWAEATPTDAGIVAYFWYPAPDLLLAGPPSDAAKVLWVSRKEQSGHLAVTAHPLYAISPVVRFDFPAASSPNGNYPSGIALPSAGCWRLDLVVGAARASIDLLVGSAPAPATPSPWPTADLPALVVADGDEVTATGRVRDVSGSLFLCGDIGQWASGGGSSNRWGVPVTGVDPATLPGWSERDQRSDFVTIRGTWAGGRIPVEEVGPVVPSRTGLRAPPPLACPAPSGGWQPGLPGEAAARPLNDEVTSHPDLYSGLWAAEIPPAESGGGRVTVAVVGTVGDVAMVQLQLAQIYAYNLCVTKVDYARSDLLSAQTRLAELHRKDWFSSVDTGWNRVYLKLLVLDTGAAQLIGADADKIEIDPLVQKAAT